MIDSFRITRRRMLKGSAIAGVGLAWHPLWNQLLANSSAARKAEHCILVFLEGGPSHIDTFDPKPGAKTGGPFQAIATAVPGIQISQHLPKLAAVADKLALIRSLHSKEGDHDRANSLLHTGYLPSPRLQYPALGASVAQRFDAPEAEVPQYVSINTAPGPGVLGPQFGPFRIDDINNPAPALQLPEGFADERLRRRLTALEQFNRRFGETNASLLGNDLTQLALRADRMRKHEVFKPYDPNESDRELFLRYGGEVNDGYLARACLLARRLVESGVRFVEIQYGGWDTHTDNFGQVENLSASLDAGLATLMTDLSDRGLLEKTLVVCVGEFGRTPDINGDNGRDHHPDVFSALVAGGGVRGGQVIGTSDADGAQPKDRPVSVADFHATLFTALGMDVTKDYFAPDGRLLKLTDGGTPVQELLG